MKTQLIRFSAFFAFILFITRTATPQYVTPISILDVPPTKAPIVIDGKPDSSYSAWQYTMICKESGAGVIAHVGDSTDFNARFKVCWDYKYLYFIADVIDDVEEDYKIGDDMPWTWDNVEVYMDLDTNSSTQAYSNTSTTEMRFNRGLLDSEGNDSLVESNSRGAGGPVLTDDSYRIAQIKQYKFFENHQLTLNGKPGWHFEIAIPWSAATDSSTVDIHNLTVQGGGTVLGFDVQAADADLPGSPEDIGRNGINGAQSFWDLDDPAGTGNEDNAWDNRLVFGFIHLIGVPDTVAPVLAEVYSPSDSLALLAIDSICDMNDSLNWNTEPDPGKWDGVTWDTSTIKRVVSLDVHNKNLTGSPDFSPLAKLQSLDISNNEISTLDVSSLTHLTNLSCANNKLPFSSLYTGINVTTFDYIPQKKIFEPLTYNQPLVLDYLQEYKFDTAVTTFVFYKDNVEQETNQTSFFSTSQNGTYHCEMTNNEFPGLTLVTEDIVVQIPVSSISKIDRTSGIEIYPNPTNGIINIHLAPEMTDVNISLFSIVGEQVYAKKIDNSGDTKLDLSDFNQGVYVLRITTNGITESKRIVLKK